MSMSLELVEEPDDNDIVRYGDPPPEVKMAFEQYKLLGSSRSVTNLARHYTAMKTKDKHAPVPTTSEFVLARWEREWNWKALAWEYDAEAATAYTQARKEQLKKLYKNTSDRADKLMKKADDGLAKIKADEMSASDVLKFMVEGNKMKKESEEAIIKLDDPKNVDSGSETGDIFDVMRKVMLLHVTNTTNIQNNFAKDSEE